MKKYGNTQNWRCWGMGNLHIVDRRGCPLVELLERTTLQYLLKHGMLFFFLNNRVFLLINCQACLSKLSPHILWLYTLSRRLPRWHSGKESACNSGNSGLIPGPGRSPGEWNGYPHQYSYLGNLMDRGAWQAIVHGVTKNQSWLSG